jgi:DNA helicase-2/ATP-dependent DNA helicase PcrA
VTEFSLTSEQKRAVEYSNGPLMIIAGAGTGKTTVITQRILHIISSGLATPDEILALTFTEKASKDMQQRVDELLPLGSLTNWILTFHSFCDRILRQEGIHIGLNSNYKLFTEAEKIQFMREHIFDFSLNYFRPLGNPIKFVTSCLQHFSRLQDENITPAEYLSWCDTKKQTISSTEEEFSHAQYTELANAYKTYESLKLEYDYLDFGDLIMRTIQLFRERPNVLHQYQKQFRYILVDEFQDTNFAQCELAFLLSGLTGNITIVGDDDQSIYRFRGASLSNMQSFRSKYPHCEIVVLTQNYRSGQHILDASYKLINNNNPDRLEVTEHIDKKLKAVFPIQDDIVFFHTHRAEDEVDRVIEEIRRLVEKEQYDFRDIAILVRANAHADMFVHALEREGIPHQFLGPTKLFQTKVISFLVSYLRLLTDPEDSSSAFQLFSYPFFSIPTKDVLSLFLYSQKHSVSFLDAVRDLSSFSIPDTSKLAITTLLAHIDAGMSSLLTKTAGQILYDFVQNTGYLSQLSNPKDKEQELEFQNVSLFFQKLKSYETDHSDSKVFAVLEWITLHSELGESPSGASLDWSEENAISLLTVHSSKGLEFPVVFLVTLVSQRFPSVSRVDTLPIPEDLIKERLPNGDFHIQEERRLFYVGMTRAKEKLYLTASDYYGEAKREKALSPFITEALGDSIDAGFVKKKPDLVSSDSEGSDKPSVVLTHLSYSQIETFLICPLHYQLKYLYHIPTPASASQSFGITIHRIVNFILLFEANQVAIRLADIFLVVCHASIILPKAACTRNSAN